MPQLPVIPPAGSGAMLLLLGLPLTVVNALPAASTGTANSTQFSVQPRGEGADRNITLTAVPNGNVTTFTADLEVSSDGATTWQKRQTGIALIAASVSTQAVVANIQAGLLYRLNVTTNTGGTAVTINATIN